MFRKSQITVFIILGILIIAIFGFMFYITQEVSRIKLETEANRIVDSILATTPLNYYVTLCLEEATKRAVNISGRQGGPLYPEDFEGFKTLDYGSEYVAYAVNNFTDSPVPPQYPCYQGPYFDTPPAFCGYMNSPLFSEQLKNIAFGITFMRPLCRYGQCTADNMNISGATYKISEQTNDSFNTTIQESLEKFIADYTSSCARQISDNPATTAAFQAFNVTMGDIKINMTFGYNGVEVVADYPLSIKIQDVEPIIRILKFGYFSPVRFKAVYKFAMHMAGTENKELDFDISSNWTNDSYFVSSSVVNTQKIYNYLTGTEDTLVEIVDNDTNHYLRNGPFVFRFAVQNRPPVLDYIPGYVSYGPETTEGSFLNKYTLGTNMSDIAVVEGDIIEIHPNAKDPDGDEVYYTFEGWKETYDEEFVEGSGCRTNPSACIISVPGEPHNWTNSELYTQSNHTAVSYKTTHSDIGPHEVIVCAVEKNNNNHQDCQAVRILVDDVFIVVANITMNYDTCFGDLSNNSLISIEDPICLNGDVIDYFNPGVTIYYWNTYEGLEQKLIYNGTKSFIVLPRDYTTAEYVPGKINYFASTGLKNFTLGVIRGSGGGTTTGSDSVLAEAKQCIPHRAGTAPYPFDLIDDSRYGTTNTSNTTYPLGRFSANHTCCEGEPSDSSGESWSFSPIEKTCYNYTEYGLWNANFTNISLLVQQTTGEDFFADLYKSGYHIATEYYSRTPPEPWNDNRTNDIMMRSFLSHCSGESGNFCGHNVTEFFTNITACKDNVSTEFARCEGGSRIASLAAPSCTKFTDTTFEQYMGTQDSNFCNGPKCTDADYNGTNSGYGEGADEDKYFLCNATCFEGNCVKPASCTNCRSLGFASKEGDKNYTKRQDLNYIIGSCDSSGILNSCTTTEGTITDTCLDGDMLVEYYAGDILNNPLPYANDTVSCKNLGIEEAAHIEINPSTGREICTGGKLARCSDGACVAEQTGSATGSCVGGGLITTAKYNKPITKDTNSNGIPESCGIEQVSAGSSQIACETCSGIWNSATNTCS